MSPEGESNGENQVAREAAETYLRYGNSIPPHDELQQLVGRMRPETRDLHILTICGGTYLDLARHPKTNPDETLMLVNRAMKKIDAVTAMSWRNSGAEKIQYVFRAGLYKAYADKYRKTLAGEAVTIEDEGMLYKRFIRLARGVLRPAYALPSGGALDNIKGMEFEIGMHLLNARFNLKHGEILQSMWPSLPREDEPHDNNYQEKTGWDAAVTSGAFLDQTSCHYLQLKLGTNTKNYDPAITIISGSDDLLTETANHFLILFLKEHHLLPEESDAEVTTELDIHERLFLTKLGWRFPSPSAEPAST